MVPASTPTVTKGNTLPISYRRQCPNPTTTRAESFGLTTT